MRMNPWSRIASLAALALVACGTESASGPPRVTCDDGACEDATDDANVPVEDVAADTGAPDVSPPDVGPDAVDDAGLDVPDVPPSPDVPPDTNSDAAPADVTPPRDVPPPRPTSRALRDYLPCEDNLDCPVGFGTCVTQLTYSHADANGVREVSVASLLPEGAPRGVCSAACTAGVDQCSGYLTTDEAGVAHPWTCQILVEGAAPYPGGTNWDGSPSLTDPDLTVSIAAVTRGRSFAALCRPPFQIHPDRPDDFCAPCDVDSECADGACWRAAPGTDGVCLASCDTAADCPLGFGCADEGDDAGWCVPLAGTCGACRDLDGDGFGTGLCDADGVSTTAHDCDDDDPTRYYDPANPTHPFPALCTSDDYNCNGVPDDVEQIGNRAITVRVEPDEGEPYTATAHCTACGDVCGGRGTNASYRCVSSEDVPRCEMTCDDASDGSIFVDCDGDPSNGCEVDFGARLDADVDAYAAWDGSLPAPVTELSYLDCDGDGFGDPNRPLQACTDPTSRPTVCEGVERASPTAPWAVTNRADCNDDARTSYPGAPELCDGEDNNCNGVSDPDDTVEGVGEACSLARPGLCDVGVRVCDEPATGLRCTPTATTPIPNPIAACGNYAPICNASETRTAAQITALLGTACTHPTNPSVGTCRNEWACRATAPNPSSHVYCNAVVTPTTDLPDLEMVDSNCDRMDGDISRSVFVDASYVGTSTGSATQPFRDIQSAINLATAAGRNQVIIAEGTYSITQPLTLKNGVGLYGGYLRQTPAWTRNTASNRRPLVVVSGEGQNGWLRAIVATGTTSVTNIQGLNIQMERPTSEGTGAIGVDCSNCNGLRLVNMTITMQGGAQGRAGVANPSTAPQGAAGSGGSRGEFPGGGAGSDARSCALSVTSGNGGRGGSGSAAGVAGGNGTGGGTTDAPPGGSQSNGGGGGTGRIGSGDAGGHGTAGREAGQNPVPATGYRVLTSNYPVAQLAVAGHHGGSGAGGGGGGGTAWYFGEGARSGGGGGSGGCGGAGGAPGGPGGSTYGILLRTASTISAQSVIISPGSGGIGGTGANGQAAGPGGGGGQGGQGPSGSPVNGGNGGIGGGGAGGNGGNGGNGGHAAAVMRASGASVTNVIVGGSLSSTLNAGIGGGGGAPGAGGFGGLNTNGGNSGAVGRTGRQGAAGRGGITEVTQTFP